MASIDTPFTQHSGTRPGGRLSAVVSGFRTWNDLRVTRKALSRLSDHELEDIGLTRADVADWGRRS
jgi:uncharacterized protein YjiS (DUF1127 family)